MGSRLGSPASLPGTSQIASRSWPFGQRCACPGSTLEPGYSACCRFVGNAGNLAAGTGAGDGGGVQVKGSNKNRKVDVHIADTLFQYNFNVQGAGLYLGRFAEGLIERCTFLRNTAYANGGASYKGGVVRMKLIRARAFVSTTWHSSFLALSSELVVFNYREAVYFSNTILLISSMEPASNLRK